MNTVEFQFNEGTIQQRAMSAMAAKGWQIVSEPIQVDSKEIVGDVVNYAVSMQWYLLKNGRVETQANWRKELSEVLENLIL